MSDFGLSRSASQSIPPQRSLRGRVVAVLRFALRLLLSPARLLLSLRRSMTAASVTLMLIGIITVNIIWGYPWNGLFAACASMFFVGWIINRIMRPNLSIDFSLPNSAPAGQPFPVVTHVRNGGRLPAMDLRIAYRIVKPSRRRKLKQAAMSRDPKASCFQALSPPQTVSLLRPRERTNLNTSLSFGNRGIHVLPDVVATSTFPFHLFRSSRVTRSDTQIAITPPLIHGNEDSLARALLDALGGWSRKLLSGDALDYTGSREYVVGMPVRRWDFTSWARLGRPIVREFQSPSIQMVTLIVDTSLDDMPGQHESDHAELLERVLSFAATAVTDLTRKTIRVRMYVTSEPTSGFEGVGSQQCVVDSEALLIRLAGAESVAASEADIRSQQVLDQVGRLPVLLLTGRSLLKEESSFPPSVTVIRVDAPHASGSGSDSPLIRRRRKTRPVAELQAQSGVA